MIQAAFGYGAVADRGASAATQNEAATSLSIFADRAALRAQMRDDALAAGLRIVAEGELGALIADAGTSEVASRSSGGMLNDAVPGNVASGTVVLGDVVLVDCPVVDAAAMAALSRLDLGAARSGARLIVSTSVTGIDDVFACMDQSDPQLLVDPSRADRAIALGEALVRVPRAQVHELSEEDRIAVLRLTEQVGQIAQRLDRLTAPADTVPAGASDRDLFRYEARPWRDAEAVRATQPGWRGETAAPAGGPARGSAGGSARGPTADRPVLPDARLVRQIIRQRQLRGRFLDPELFADPAWDMLLDLTAAAAEKVRVSVSSLCIAASVPPTTALRWIRQMTDAGLLARSDDDQDRRRAFISLTDRSRAAMTAFFDELGEVAPVPV